MRCIPDLLIWSVIFFWNFWPTALTLEAQPMSIYNRQFYSKGFQKRPEPSKQVYNDSLCTRACWVSAPGPVSLMKSGWRLAAEPSFVCLCLQLLWAVPTRSSGRWDLGKGLGIISHVTPPLYFDGEDRLRGVEVGKIFHYIKRTKEETGSQWPLARPQECANPGNWPLARLLRGCWLGKTGSLTAAKNVDNGLLDILLLKVRLLFYYHQR